jgi:hypothetical protein
MAKRAGPAGNGSRVYPGKCRVPGCGRPINVPKHKLCVAHVTRFYRTGGVGGAKVKRLRKHEPFAGA